MFLFLEARLGLSRVQLAGEPIEAWHVARLIDRDAPNHRAANLLEARRVPVFPAHIIQSAGREDFRLPVRGHPARDLQAERLGAAVYFESAALDHKCDFHNSSSPAG